VLVHDAKEAFQISETGGFVAKGLGYPLVYAIPVIDRQPVFSQFGF
jgi:hypothetical protein